MVVGKTVMTIFEVKICFEIYTIVQERSGHWGRLKLMVSVPGSSPFCSFLENTTVHCGEQEERRTEPNLHEQFKAQF